MPDPSESIGALIAEGARQQQAENFAAAERAYRAVLQLDPTNPQALALLGMLSGMFGEFQAAIELFLKALARDPDNADLYHNLGETYRHLDEPAKALPCFAKAIELRPDHFMAYRSAADTALAAIEQAAKPEHAEGLGRLALQYRRKLGTLLHQKKHPDALGVLREALDLNPIDPETLVKLADSLHDHGLVTESAELLQRAAALAPGNANIFNDLGRALYALRRWEEQEQAFRTALKLDPGHKVARVNLVTCDLMHRLYKDEPTPAEIFARHRDWGREIAAELAATAAAEARPFANSRDPDRRLRVGFVSGDFRDHPVAHFFRPLLVHHDRAALDIYCYAETERTDGYTPVLQAAGGTWRLASVTASDTALRAQLRADAIDIAIDLAGHTAGTRLQALAVRATPVTASWLGYPATTGLPTIDWRITDALADPPGFERYHTEKLLRLPAGFLCYEPRAENPPAVAPLPALARGAITFGSFNNSLKLTPATLRCWAAILAALPEARLVLKAAYLADPGVRGSFHRQFAAFGIAADRVELRPQLADLGTHLTAYGEIDIALDPLIYNGTTTTCEALWMGVPVVSLIGNRHAARVGFDLLSRIGLTELAAPDVDAYVALAVSLAQNLPRLQRLRRELRDRMRRSPLCDPPGFARQFEG
ncbi:MAG TPA: tetratricopeptide repeat protein, partial [Stellaceae bacterium]|nr:tetratricopeptide repeat protein [Stellaceae bacterium]